MEVREIDIFLEIFCDVMNDLGLSRATEYYSCGKNAYRVLWRGKDNYIFSTSLWFISRNYDYESEIERIRLVSSNEDDLEPILMKMSLFPKNWEENHWGKVRLIANVALNHYHAFLYENELRPQRYKESIEDIINKWENNFYQIMNNS